MGSAMGSVILVFQHGLGYTRRLFDVDRIDTGCVDAD